MDTIETIPTWGYKADGSAQIFALAPGADLPEGWSASPTVITDPSRATADALTMRATGLTFAHPVEEPASEPSAVDELLAALTEIDRLKGVIEAGSAENERLASELDEADKLLGAAADSYKKATDDLAAFREQLAKAHEDTRVNAAERDAAKAAVDALTADLAKAQADLEAATAPKPATATKGK